MRLKSLTDFVAGLAGVTSAADRQGSGTSLPIQQDRLGFRALCAAVQMDRLGFLYAPLKLDPSRNRTTGHVSSRPQFTRDG